MPVHLFTATFQGLSGLPEDQMVNTFHFDGSGADPENVVDMIDDFFITVPTAGGTLTVAQRMTDQSISNQVTYRGYDLSDPMPRVPVIEQTRTLVGLGDGTALPREVAACVSYQADRVAGENQARRRGRFYVGALDTACTDAGLQSSAFNTLLRNKAGDLLDASDASASWTWVVYSPTSSTSAAVTNGWVDDAWDTQRRRGIRATIRREFPV